MLIFQDFSFLQLLLWIVGGLFLLSLGRMVSLARQNRQIAKDNAKMEKWAVAQQAELISVHHDAQSWRAKTQRQFDAVRADLGARLEQAERGNAHAQKQADTTQEKALISAMAKINELETRLAAAKTAPPSAAAAAPSIPALPAMETLRMESLQAELAGVKADLDAQRHQNGELQRALLLARRKQPPARRNGARVPRHG
ncbi:MAG: hypothetical protein ACO1TE_13540 [Prosthecobacter sp.]